ncbi:hypothetical protein RGU70_04435 [Herbaspirillum sp. RTI4]|uniref:hypothetical protein n=1 Tax=Herbaspirillum sp. RTI4 TaxID=3048640 RepID=UPI002AB48073|nr:hypothetical protein [Herbaspirillum sp. RTI4]MDY7577568.1 hypothetical protein [Herbaspirillum sp. RTI4]MEA9981043.1 hypothetical protein [Herbaspirillum sp. RTI4]
MNLIKIWPALALTACLSSSLAHAQQNNLAPPPPELQKLEEGEPPAVTIKNPNEAPKANGITEKRSQGVVTDVEVTSGGSTYHMKPHQVGTALPGDAQSRGQTNPQWVVKEFDWGSGKPPGTPPSVVTPSR